MWRKTTRGKGQGKGEKAKGGKQGEARKKIRQLFCCLIEYGELFELCPECHFLLIFARLAGTLRIVFDEPGEEFRVVDFLTEHLFAANGKEGLALVGSYRLVLL